jgi:hypothetical protein
MGTAINQGIQLCEGILAIMGKSAKMKIRGREVKIGALRADLLALAASQRETLAARAAYLDTATAHRAFAAKVGFDAILGPLVTQLRATLSPEQLQLCGLTLPKKRRGLTAEEQALANAKSRATRAARGVQGSKQRRNRSVQEGLAAAYGTNPTELSVTTLSYEQVAS